jgi:glycosyltransferase involved in cell wall biosynthesis
MDKKPLVSILSSVYNEHLYIEQTIRSVLNQTYAHWEWIILDDGSTDGTEEILRGIKDKRVKCVFQENIGYLAKNLNKALKISCGSIIAPLDGDDYWPENKLEVQVKSFEDRDVVLSYGECFLINPEGKTIAHIGLPEDSSIANNNPAGSALKRLLVDIDCFICNTTVMYRRSILLDAGGFVEENGLSPDFPTWVKLSLAGRFSAIPACLGYYRKHMKSTTFNTNQKYYFENLVNFLREFYQQNVPGLRDIGLCFDMDTLENHWNHIKIKNNFIYRLTLISSYIGVDIVNPLICYINRKSYMKKLLKRILQI